MLNIHKVKSWQTLNGTVVPLNSLGISRCIPELCNASSPREVSWMKREMSVYTQNCTATNTVIANARYYFEIHGRIVSRLPYGDIEQIGEELWRAFEDRRKVFIFGNGGSASLACHFACDLGKGTALPEAGHKRFQVLALTSNVAL